MGDSSEDVESPVDSRLLLRCRTLLGTLGLDLSGVEVRLLEEDDGKVDIISKPEDTEKHMLKENRRSLQERTVVLPWYHDGNTIVLLYTVEVKSLHPPFRICNVNYFKKEGSYKMHVVLL